ncbi:MAG: 50S ribosomal protein L17 [Dehalococcoidia bacterium]|nr:50S ribosomal protein L17 [Dehalococcoidia bacterium]|tara:strand:+ start:5060 stop:5434 length:375 start_codon:yes stop_codon:yes gene_type:complete
MRHRVKGKKLGRRTDHREAMVNNLVSELFKRERITTTEAKAREVRGAAEKMITKGRRGTLNDRRLVAAKLSDDSVVKKLFNEIGPRFANREGGYTRLLKLMQRKGDSASMALLEIVEEEVKDEP